MSALEIKVIETELGFLFQIIKQDYREFDFNYGNNKYKASNKFELESYLYPAIASGEEKKLYVGGQDSSKDLDVFYTSDREYIQEMKQAVREYNESMSHRIEKAICKVEIVK